MFKGKEYMCLLSGEVIMARNVFEAYRYFKDNYECKVPAKLSLKHVITLKKYFKRYCGH